jgi:hypothetical protein
MSGLIPKDEKRSSVADGRFRITADDTARFHWQRRGPQVAQHTRTDMSTWTTETQMAGRPEDVMGVLTRPEAIERWAPIPFEVLEFEGDRLVAGDTARVRGGLAGRRLEFTVDIAEASSGRLALTAKGPIDIDVEYTAEAIPAGSNVTARVAVSGRGLLGRILAQATDALLAGGALRAAVSRIARDLETVAA